MVYSLASISLMGAFVSEEQIRFYFDFLCPYSYIAHLHLQRVLKDRNLLFAAYAVGLQNPMPNAPLALPNDDPARWEKLRKRADPLGITIKGPPGAIDSLLARRGVLRYQGLSRQEYVDGVFKAVFRDHIDINNEKSLSSYLQAEGVDIHPLLSALADDSTQGMCDDVAKLWELRRLRIIPTIEIGEERAAGLIEPRGLENLLARVIY